VSTDRKELVSGLGVRDNLLWIADRWPRLAALVGGTGGGQALTGMPGCASIIPPLVVDIEIVNLMDEIENEVARYYGHILMDETDWTPTTSSMPGLLADVARRYGHFTSDPQMAFGFAADAREKRAKVEKVLDQTVPAKYVGPCHTAECIGELYIREDSSAGECKVCGVAFLATEQRAWIFGRYQERLMTATEIGDAFKTLDINRAPSTIRSWIKREQLVEVEDGLYSLADAKALAEKGRVAA